MISTRTIKRISRSLLAILLFAQAALAAAGCDRLQRSPADAIAMAGTEAPPCHQQDQGPVSNACVAHCLADFQSLDKHSVAIPALGDAAVLLVELPVPQRALSMFAAAVPARASAPPPRILFSKLLI